MALIDLKTDLKSLKYGRDRVGGGSSGQPFVQKPLPTSLSQTGNTGGFDSFVRGGTLTIGKTADDVSRLTQLLLTPKTLQGPLFTAKQNLLSRQAVKTQASGIINQGTYLPFTTITQAGISFLGAHETLFLDSPNYFDAVKDQQSGEVSDNNRLVKFYKSKIDDEAEGGGGLLYNYPGGPGSIGGFGSTTIKLAGDRTGINNDKEDRKYVNVGFKNTLFRQDTLGNLGEDLKIYYNYESAKAKPITLYKTVLNKGVTSYLTNTNVTNPYYTLGQEILNSQEVLPSFGQGVKGTQSNIYESRQDPSTLLTFDQIQEATPIQDGAIAIDPDDFRKETSLAPQAPTVSDFNRGKTYQIGFPGYKNLNRNIDPANAPLSAGFSTDRVNFSPVENKETPTLVDNDLIPFYIQFYNYDSKNTVVQFRAFLKGFNDNFTGEWNPFRYMGRGENFYTYQGFNREISLGFTVHAQSKAELLPQYRKLNYLASTLAPDYSSAGFMRGTFITLTVGDYLTQVPGVLTGLSMQIPDNSPWDIGRKNDGSRTNLKDRLPHMIEVSNFSFKPIHSFLPEKQRPFISAVERKTSVEVGPLT